MVENTQQFTPERDWPGRRMWEKFIVGVPTCSVETRLCLSQRQTIRVSPDRGRIYRQISLALGRGTLGLPRRPKD